MDLSLSIKLFCSVFSFQRSNMRWFNWTRMAAALVLLPVFCCLLFINRLCLLLDYVLFPTFTRQKVIQPVFIIAAPRSATTYLFHSLVEHQERFTAFRLWEIILAPSITQKYFFRGLLYCDQRIGRPLRKMVRFIEARVFGNFTRIHKIGLGLPEEDEAVLLWNMSTIYLNFFFPDTHHFDSYFRFDEALPPARRHKIFRYYANCIKRHNYVFNRDGHKTFLSKNPAMMAKVKTLHDFYPDARILNINRCPARTIPSTIELNNSIYKFFTSKKASPALEARTTAILMDWYKMAHRYLRQYYSGQMVEIDFAKLVALDEQTINDICCLLCLDKRTLLKPGKDNAKQVGHISSHRYDYLDGQALEQVLTELPFLSSYCKVPSRKQARPDGAPAV